MASQIKFLTLIETNELIRAEIKTLLIKTIKQEKIAKKLTEELLTKLFIAKNNPCLFNN
jgi:hypothetical protein